MNSNISKIGRLWCPWRSKYVQNIGENKECFLCYELKNKNNSPLIVKTGRKVFTILNKYPYNAGHIMITPKKHKGKIEAITSDEWSEMYSHLILIKQALDKLMKPQGYNVGINIGRVAGAGLLSHLHLHIVPRWKGDTNFMTILSDTKIVSQSLFDLSKKLTMMLHKKE